ncbi:MAG: NADH-quinone oxidoreductase subunit NuoE [Candidatus Hydrogenedentes bacterium]|nr:NADH-quinone oxidoreductase subunit NuoE [Candidatus Hydrogenedentota bacterium]
MLSDILKSEIESHIHEPEHRESACTEALRIVQRDRGWIDDESLKDIAEFLGMTTHELDGVATFFNLIHRRPVGRHVIRVCSSVSCWVLGYDALREALLAKLDVLLGQTTADGRFTVLPNQCLGTCDRAPAMMIGADLYQDIDPTRLDEILDRYA